MTSAMDSTPDLDALETEHTELAAPRLRAPRSDAARATVSPSMGLMLARARVVFERLAPDDPRARLLQVAVLRRDEILLEALLRRLDALPLA
jgi:hypothetical protein